MSRSTPVTITGTYALRPNPCTSRPCLPGLVYAIETTTIYFPTHSHKLLAATHTWRHYTPQPGDTVIVKGTLHAQQDNLGRPIKTIEVEVISLAPVHNAI